MTNDTVRYEVPFYYEPYPYQRQAWSRRRSGRYTYYIKLWARQLGKDTDDNQYLLNTTWRNPGTNNVYIGLNNKWVRENIWNKDLDRRSPWSEYPEEFINPKSSELVVEFLNNTKEFNAEDKKEGRIKYIGLADNDNVVGSSYYNWVISEAGLYGPNAWDTIKPIWNRKQAIGEDFLVSINGTPRGIKNSYYDLISELTGKEEPNDFPGEHESEKGLVYVDKIRARDAMILSPRDPNKLIRLYTDEFLEELKQDCIRKYGNDNLYRQEYECDFTTVNAGLVYQAIEQLNKEGRYTIFNLETDKPVYMAWDISSKGKETDASAVVVYQYINGQVRWFDAEEYRGLSVIDCVAELSKKDYFHLIRFAALPWDAERSASSETPAEECKKVFPNINWHVLDRELVHRGIDLVRKKMPNMMIHKTNCTRLFEAFNDYAYTYNENLRQWSSKPQHNWASHFMDATRYGVMAIEEIGYYRLNSDGSLVETAPFYGEQAKAWERNKQRAERQFDNKMNNYLSSYINENERVQLW